MPFSIKSKNKKIKNKKLSLTNSNNNGSNKLLNIYPLIVYHKEHRRKIRRKIKLTKWIFSHKKISKSQLVLMEDTFHQALQIMSYFH